jgi:Cu(I)/Ag(I) efflux system membrane fusion protein
MADNEFVSPDRGSAAATAGSALGGPAGVVGAIQAGTNDEGTGGSGMPPDGPLTRRQKLRLVGLVILKRVRFIAVLAAVGLFICKWDMVMSYWEKWTQSRRAASQELEAGHEFYCPMDPQVVRSTYEPNGDVPKCPICGMPLSIRQKGEAAKLPEGITGRVQLSPERIQLAGIKTVTADYRPVARQTKTVGYIAFDESRLSRIVSRVDGYVEKLYVNETFTVVRKGDPLAEIYSPELYSTARELVVANQSGGVADLAAAARTKLLLLGVGQQEIEGILASREPSPRLVIRSPQEGYVVEKKLVVGASVEAKMTLFEVADLSTVWIEAEVYEKDIPFLEVGQKVEAEVEAYPHRVFGGKLAMVYPQVETATRTNRVRLKVDNPRHELRPGMFATVWINTPLESVEPFKTAARSRPFPGHRPEVGPAKAGLTAAAHEHSSPRSNPLPKGEGNEDSPPQYEFLTVPERAVVDTGTTKVVYVEREPGMFEGVEVELGPRQGNYYPVIKGLAQGDKVAAAGGFLIDAETRLNPAAAATYFGASGGAQSSGRPAASSNPTQPEKEQSPADRAPPDQPPAEVPGRPKAGPEPRVAMAALEPRHLKNVEQLPEADRKLALKQRICPVTGFALGSMGVPVKITLRGQTVFLCCKGCLGKAKRNPDEMLKRLAEAAQASGD